MGVSPKDNAQNVNHGSETNHHVRDGCMVEMNGPKCRQKDTRQNPETCIHLHNRGDKILSQQQWRFYCTSPPAPSSGGGSMGNIREISQNLPREKSDLGALQTIC